MTLSLRDAIALKYILAQTNTDVLEDLYNELTEFTDKIPELDSVEAEDFIEIESDGQLINIDEYELDYIVEGIEPK